METARKKLKLLASRFIIVMQVNSSLFTIHSSFFTPNYTSVATISSRVPGNMSITGISGMV